MVSGLAYASCHCSLVYPLPTFLLYLVLMRFKASRDMWTTVQCHMLLSLFPWQLCHTSLGPCVFSLHFLERQ